MRVIEERVQRVPTLIRARRRVDAPRHRVADVGIARRAVPIAAFASRSHGDRTAIASRRRIARLNEGCAQKLDYGDSARGAVTRARVEDVARGARGPTRAARARATAATTTATAATAATARRRGGANDAAPSDADALDS